MLVLCVFNALIFAYLAIFMGVLRILVYNYIK